jgi:hypothetical protein
MSNLRIAGIIIGIIGLLTTFLIYRGPKWKRLNFVLLTLFNLCLISVSINPNIVNFIRDALSLQVYQYGRLIALLIISNIFLLFFSFYTRSKLEDMRLQFDGLVRNLATSNLVEDLKTEGKIKPIMVIIPVYNEAENLKELLPSMPEQIEGLDIGVLVVDDGSDDDTLNVALKAGVLAVRNAVKRGGGAALRVGYDILRQGGTKICVTMDGDGQHQPEEIERLVRPIVEKQYDFVIGSRILGRTEKYSALRLAGVRIFSIMISNLLGKKITDPSSGFRAFMMDCLNGMILYEDQYHTTELITNIVRSGKNLGEVPVTIRKRRFGKSKKGKDWRYGINFAKTLIKNWWR